MTVPRPGGEELDNELPLLPEPTSPGGEELDADVLESIDRQEPGAGVPTGAGPGRRAIDEPRGRGQLLRSSAVVGVGTGLSRVTGLVRVLALAYALGDTALADGYNLANVTPNIIYELLLGGVLSATLVPVFVERRDHGDDDAIDAAVTSITVVLVVLAAAMAIAAPWIFRIFTIGQPADAAAAQASVAVPLMRLFAPQVLFYGLTAVGTALLNSHKRFAAPAFAPVLNNVVLVCVLLELRHLAGGLPSIDQVRSDTTLLVLLGLGTTAGIAAMTVVLWPAIRRAGIRLHLRWDWHNPAIRTIATLSGWTIGYVIANQVALTIVLTLAHGSGEGHVTAYTYAFVFFQLPHGLLAVSLMTTYLPELSTAAARHDLAAFRDRFLEGARTLLLLVVPAAVGLFLLARPLMSALFAYGDFRRAGPITADILRALALGLPAYSLYLFSLRGFYALKDTRTPFVVNVIENGVNVAMAFALVGALSVQGLGLAYSLAYVAGATAALVLLARRVGSLWTAATAASVVRTLAASALMAAGVWLVTLTVGSAGGAGALLRCVAGLLVGIVVYFGALVALRSQDVAGLTERVRRRRSTAGR